MSGLYLGRNGNFIEKTVVESLEMGLLARGDGAEVILQKIKAGKPFYVFPGDDPETMEFFYVLEGQCVYESKEATTRLQAGDYFYVQYLQDTVYFRAVTDVQILWLTTKPAFHTISSSIHELIKVVKRVEEKDRYTYQHSVRVQSYSLRIAKELQLPKDRLEDLYYASLFHDVGKINTPEYILNKTGKLTEEEFAYIKQHSVDGCEMVKSTYYSGIADIILQHHERMDGSGYPHGIKGNDIALEARIIGVADTYDAMTSDRPYRKGLDSAFAMNEIKKYSGIHFDPEIVDAFERSLLADGILV